MMVCNCIAGRIPLPPPLLSSLLHLPYGSRRSGCHSAFRTPLAISQPCSLSGRPPLCLPRRRLPHNRPCFGCVPTSPLVVRRGAWVGIVLAGVAPLSACFCRERLKDGCNPARWLDLMSKHSPSSSSSLATLARCKLGCLGVVAVEQVLSERPADTITRPLSPHFHVAPVALPAGLHGRSEVGVVPHACYPRQSPIGGRIALPPLAGG